MPFHIASRKPCVECHSSPASADDPWQWLSRSNSMSASLVIVAVHA